MPSIKTSQLITVPADPDYRPTPSLFRAFPKKVREDILSGRLELVCRRVTSPNQWGLVPAGTVQGAYGAPEGWQPLPWYHVALGYFEEAQSSPELVDYGPAIAAFALCAKTDAFADQGKPLWTRYRLNAAKAAEAQSRRRDAEAAAAWFNTQQGAAPRTVQELSDLEVALLRRMYTGGYVWMYRELADAALELVRAGYARVDASGGLQRAGDPVDLSETADRSIELNLALPAYL